ncbi:hypothetical protein ACI6Q2_05555 [Chitinophagaceae bacterium LWZ2-11]
MKTSNFTAMVMGVFIMFSIAIIACKKNGDIVVTPPAQSNFINATSGAYYVSNSPTSAFKIPIGVTSTANVDRKVTVSVSSPTGAAAGVQYNLPSTTVTIPAGKAVDSLTVNGLFAGYPGTRRDTLTVKLTGGDIPASSYNNTYYLIMQKYCDVLLTNLNGVYKTSNDIQAGTAYGPYSTTVTSTSTGPTSATLTFVNFGAGGFGPFAPTDQSLSTGIKVNIDWSNPASFTTNVPTQLFYVDSQYGQATIKANGNGTFSSCDNTFTINYTVTVSAGSFGNFTATIKR